MLLRSTEMNKASIEVIGWISTGLLLATLIRQVYTQWKSGTAGGVSKWLFIGQTAASMGFIVYSLMLRNWVFVGSNVAILLVAIVGQVLYLRNRQNSREKSRDAGD
jgi:MtN3 and saliva related transmembrane protein